MWSLTPVTVIDWGVLQLEGVKTRLVGETVPAAVLLEAMGTVTLALGTCVRATV